MTATVYVLGALGLVALVAGLVLYQRARPEAWRMFGVVSAVVGADLLVIALALGLG